MKPQGCVEIYLINPQENELCPDEKYLLRFVFLIKKVYFYYMKWRKDELSLKEFRLLSKESREEYLLLLKGIKSEELSTNDNFILNEYVDEEKQKPIKFLEL
jgi:hypothetical protein